MKSHCAALPANTVRLSLPGETRAAFVEVDNQTTVAAKLAESIGPNDLLQVRKNIRIVNGRVILLHEDAAISNPILAKIKDTTGKG